MTLIYFLFFFSGATALVYEVAWLRLLGLSFGNTTEAASCIISVFLGGLALGAFFGGRVADRRSSGHLRLYGILELLIGLIAPFIAWLVYKLPLAIAHLSEAFGEGLGAQTWVRFVLAAIILLPPTMLMGASLPVLCKYLSLRGKFTKGFAGLYAVNMLGSVCGGLDGCVAGFTYLGVSGTILSAAVVNVYVGIRAICRKEEVIKDSVHLGSSDAGTQVESVPHPQSLAQYDLLFLCLLAGFSGFNALGYEVLWITFLRAYIIADAYTFAFTVSCFILGLTIGSLLCLLRSPDRSYKQKLLDLSCAQILAGFACAMSLLAIPLFAQWYHAGIPILFRLLAVCFLLVTVPSIAIGLTFPIIGGLASSFRNIASYVGLVYAVNTFGCVIGTILVGLYAQRTWGSFLTFKLNVLLSALIGAAAMLRSSMSKKLLVFAGCSVPILAAFCFVLYFQDPFLTEARAMKVPSMVFYGEDSTGIVWVLKYPQYKELKTSLTLMATTNMPFKRYMRLLGALPVLACKNPENVLVVCFGTGTTAGVTSVFNNVKHEDIIDLSPMVFKAGPCFSDSSLDVLQNAKVSIHVNDGRNFLLNTRKKYDVITFEPPPLAQTGAVNLYTREFYEVVKRHLQPGGVVGQWVPSYDVTEPLWKMMLRSFLLTFPHASLWISNSGEGIILGSEQPLELDASLMKEQVHSVPQLRLALDEVGLSDPHDILSTFVMADEKLMKYVGDAKPVTDDHPYLEFYSPFVGRTITDLEICQSAGNLEEGLKNSIRLSGIDAEDLKDRFEAMQSFRLSEAPRLWPDTPRPDINIQESIKQAVKLNPNNKFFQWYAALCGALATGGKQRNL